MADPRHLGRRENPPTAPGAKPKPPAPPGPAPIITDKPIKPIVKAFLPFMSPEDKASQMALYGLGPATPKQQAKAALRPPAMPPLEIGGDVRNAYLSVDRANQALSALQATGAKGPGVQFLRNAIGLLRTYGSNGGEGMSRAAYSTLATQLSNLITGAKKDSSLSPYVGLSQTFLAPTFSTGELMPQTKISGVTHWGAPSGKLFV